MKKSIRALSIIFIIVMIFPINWSYALEIGSSTTDVSSETALSETESSPDTSETLGLDSSSSTESTIEETESEPVIEETETSISVDETKSNINDKKMIRADAVPDAEGFWPVDSAATLTDYLKDSLKLKLRLTNNIDLGSTGFLLKDGMIIDGANHIITYNKGASATSGFYANQANAVIEIRNVQFGNTDGSGAVGYYGFLSGGSAANMTFIFDGVDYYSTNGQMIYNVNGSVIMRGQNTIDQRGTSTYSQEWAEINYIEIQSGYTSIKHSSNQTSGFIWSSSTSSGNPNAGVSQIIVRENARLDLQTNAAMMYGSLPPKYVVEKNGTFNLDKVTLATGGTRNQFFYSNPTQPVNFDFQENSQVNFVLPESINLGAARGSFSVGADANVSVDVASGTIFNASGTSTFNVQLANAERVEFAGTGAGTLGLNATAASTSANLSFQSKTAQKIETYATKNAALPNQTIIRTQSDLKARGATYTNVATSIDPLATEELSALGASQKLVFTQKIDPPDQVVASVSDVTATSAKLQATSFNNGSAATEVKFLFYSAVEDIDTPSKARHIITLTNFDGNNTTLDSTYLSDIQELNPNTSYWLQAVVTNQAGQSQFSPAQPFATKPDLKMINVEKVRGTTAVISGELLSDTGTWTDFTNGEANPILDNPVTYGGNYQDVQIEYSQDKAFPQDQTTAKTADLSGDKNQLFSAKLTGLSEGTTYFVRIKATGVSGDQVILAMSPLTEFQTIVEIISVEVPIEMVFKTENHDIGTAQAGKIHSEEYQVTNKGNVATKVSLTGLTKENTDAQQLLLLDNLSGVVGNDELALQMQIDNQTANAPFITSELSNKPVLIGELGISTDRQKSIQFSGKYFNPTKQAVFPTYKMTFKVEKNED